MKERRSGFLACWRSSRRGRSHERSLCGDRAPCAAGLEPAASCASARGRMVLRVGRQADLLDRRPRDRGRRPDRLSTGRAISRTHWWSRRPRHGFWSSWNQPDSRISCARLLGQPGRFPSRPWARSCQIPNDSLKLRACTGFTFSVRRAFRSRPIHKPPAGPPATVHPAQ